MAGPMGRVANRNKDYRFFTKKWETWMTEMCILHFNDVPVAELAIRFQITPSYARNLLRTEEAYALHAKIHEKTLKVLEESAVGKMAAAREKALDHVNRFLDDPNDLANEKPMAYWENTLKTLSTLDRLDRPAGGNAPVVNLQQNFSLSSSAQDRLRAALTVPSLEITPQPSVVESPRATESELHGRGNLRLEEKSQDGPSVPIELRPGTPDDV